MSKEFRILSLSDLNHGKANQLFTEELGHVLENIADEGTSWKANRIITLKVKIRATSPKRTRVITSVQCSTTIAPREPSASEMGILNTGDEIIMLSEMMLMAHMI